MRTFSHRGGIIVVCRATRFTRSSLTMSTPKKSGGKASRRARIAIALPASNAPRNPVVRALIQRGAGQSAGSHRRSVKAERRAANVSLKKSV